MKNHSRFVIGVILAMILMVAACTQPADRSEESAGGTESVPAEESVKEVSPEESSKPESVPSQTSSAPTEASMSESSEGEQTMQLVIGGNAVKVEWEDNASVQALMDLCREHPLEIQMSMYGGFEQVGRIGSSLPRNDVQTETVAGDIVLYSGNQIVIFYGSNAWAYTRLGRITDRDAAGMRELLGQGDVTITISLS